MESYTVNDKGHIIAYWCPECQCIHKIEPLSKIFYIHLDLILKKIKPDWRIA